MSQLAACCSAALEFLGLPPGWRFSTAGGYEDVWHDAKLLDAGAPTSFYDLFRVENGKIAEHWDTIEKTPPKSQWKNDNGKF